MIAKVGGRSLENSTSIFIRKGLSENSKKMSWVNPVFPIDTENSIGFIVQFLGGQARLVDDSVKSGKQDIKY